MNKRKAGKKETREYIYDETNHLVEGTNWKGDKSAYTYNGLDVRINNTQTAHSGSVYSRDYVIDYTSLERDDLMVFAEGDGQLDYVQREVYAGSERIEQFTDRSNGGYERLLYVHEDLMGNTRYYTKANGQSYAELTYDAWGMPESPNKLLNNDHGNYVYATYTGHIFDTTLDIYFAEARFYDANTRTWLAMDPIKDGDNWYQYCYSSPVNYMDPNGRFGIPGAIIGGLPSAAASAVSQIYDPATGSFDVHNIKLKRVFIDGIVGAVVGGLTPPGASMFVDGAKLNALKGVALNTVGNVVAQAAKNMFVEKVSPTKDLGIAAVSGIAGSMFNGLYEVGTKAAGKILPKLGGLVQKTIPNVANWISKTIPRFGEYAVSAVDGFFVHYSLIQAAIFFQLQECLLILEEEQGRL